MKVAGGQPDESSKGPPSRAAADDLARWSDPRLPIRIGRTRPDVILIISEIAERLSDSGETDDATSALRSQLWNLVVAMAEEDRISASQALIHARVLAAASLSKGNLTMCNGGDLMALALNLEAAEGILNPPS